jgi:hypothetical protein
VPPQTPARLSTPPPKGSLGLRYTIIYTVPGVTPQPGQQLGRIRQDLYPRAVGGPVIYTPPGQRGFGQPLQVTGWLRASPQLARTLARLGVPPRSGIPAVQQSRLPRIQRHDINRVHRPLPGSSHQERPLASQRSPAARWCCVTASQPREGGSTRRRRSRFCRSGPYPRRIRAWEYEPGRSKADHENRQWCCGGRHDGRAGSVLLGTEPGACQAGQRGAAGRGVLTRGGRSFINRPVPHGAH